MKLVLISFWVGIAWLLKPGIFPELINQYSPEDVSVSVLYKKPLRFNIYTFIVTATDSGAIRDLTVKAYRGGLLLTNFRTRVDGAVFGAEVADLDKNRFPELYVYSTSDGSGSFGQVYAWQFLPERKADIQTVNWLAGSEGYMGHDSLWLEKEKFSLCREFPVYNAGDSNAEPTGGTRMVSYQLRRIGQIYRLVATKQVSYK